MTGQVTLICLHTGHNRLNTHMNRMVNLVPSPPCTCGTEDQTTEHIRQICPAYLHLIEQIWSDGTSGAVWEERITRKDNWLHSSGWLIRIIKKITRRRLYCNHSEIGTIKFYISMKT